MPAPERTTNAAIVAAGRALLERHGTAGLTMQAVADEVGVKAPSLYKRVRDRDALIADVAAATVDDLADRIAARAAQHDDPRDRIRAIAGALRDFALERPRGYALVFGATTAAARPDEARLARSAQPAIDAARDLVGERDALDAARTLTAWANGFLMMELADAFRLGGDVGEAWSWGLERMIAAIAGDAAVDDLSRPGRARP